MARLDGKVAIVTGGAQGQGEAIVRAFVAEGARVVIADIAEDAGKTLADDLGEAAYFVSHDVGEESSWTSLTEGLLARWERIDVLANNAGILRFGNIDTAPLSDVEAIWRVNQWGVFLGMRAVVPTMKKQRSGSIINASSIEGLGGMGSVVPYCGSKWAIRGMTKAASHELGRYGIRVNSVHPGMIDTPMTRDVGGQDAMDFGATKIPMRRVGVPDDIAPGYVFLASDESRYVTGAELAIDGGVTATHAFGG
ncbi:glucose 1-dehydrogenase [Nocardioides limicola]|uniref:glucose 1-dehydrogenase n=1 Tax=Nocardioides limicola TaxID=2803368 RepID=UPI00193B8C14|nr:glucose 1-dehydrogenase [Nocardioides sp. DJM-14]